MEKMEELTPQSRKCRTKPPKHMEKMEELIPQSRKCRTKPPKHMEKMEELIRQDSRPVSGSRLTYRRAGALRRLAAL